MFGWMKGTGNNLNGWDGKDSNQVLQFVEGPKLGSISVHSHSMLTWAGAISTTRPPVCQPQDPSGDTSV
jgi:hypothetical protein